ncbi:serine/threonine protein kinase [Phormidesmis priestleyi ULC007]|uniref:non-specific serine/threonine protein kinase n=1 Tax=Phormidesmis priestleyi ULC007 TaxID=1920490 RepID=A0A2T1DER9_9CYAN|nr:serine/threonine protein kinase [Phormidesmis priestleyi ULC007]PZO53952.1 MAG: serine/threonine protein kinase [Phormidesmis priestleyi]
MVTFRILTAFLKAELSCKPFKHKQSSHPVCVFRLGSANVITLTLLHPVQLKPVQCWTFDDESVIRIGRSPDNQVILYSAVVSRHHVELRRINSVWEVESLGANGTYLDGKRIAQVPVRNGMIIRLARSGPNIQIHVGVSASHEADKLAGERTLSQRAQSKQNSATSDIEADTTQPLPAMEVLESQIPERSTAMEPPGEKLSLAGSITCDHLRKTPDFRFCIDCGAPLSVQQTIGDYQIVKLLGEGEVGFTYLVWRQGKHRVLKTLNSEWVKHPKALNLFEREAKALSQLSHPSLPQVLDFFTIEQPYLVVELIYGRSLFQQVTKWGAIPQKQAIGWMLELCEVLEYLHQQSPPVLHQDIRPHNLIRRSTPTAFREISLVDFGAVRGLGLEAKNRTSAIGYSAPEQYAGKASPASDLYSLGTTLAFLLSGQDPGEFYRYREQGYRFYAEYVPGLSAEIVQVIRKLTHPEVRDRYTSAQEVAEALKQIV